MNVHCFSVTLGNDELKKFCFKLENEYGSYQSVDCGHDYMAHLYDVFYENLADSVLPFTTDGNSVDLLKCGSTPKAYATVDFGPTGGLCCIDLLCQCHHSDREWLNAKIAL